MVKGHQYIKPIMTKCACISSGLGWDKNIKDDVIAAAKLLHWNGKGESIRSKVKGIL